MGRQKPSRIYHNLIEFNQDTERSTKLALERTLYKFKDDLYEFIKSDVYNAYSPKWYERTNSLQDKSTIETYIYKNISNAIGGGIKFNSSYYNEHSDRNLFQHGNEIQFLPVNSFLAIINDWTLQGNNNPYHFPIIERRSFWDDFLRYVNTNFNDVFAEEFRKAMGIRVSATNKNVGNISNGMNLSSSTSHLKSIDTRNLT